MTEPIRVEQENKQLSSSGLEFFTQHTQLAGECAASAHLHGAIEILYVTSGSFTVYINGVSYTAHCGDLVLLRSNTVHNVFANLDNGAYIVIKIKTSFLLNSASEDRGVLYLLHLCLHKDQQKHIFSREDLAQYSVAAVLEESLQAEKKYASDLFLKANILRLCACLLEYLSQHQPISDHSRYTVSALQSIYESMTHISRHFDQPITARECAQLVGMSYTYFSRMFKQICGKSFSAYLTEIRINHAEKELLLTNKSITEIAYQCGFSDTSYFIAQYKRLRDISPHHFRKTNTYSERNG